jgi:hypothetical protein
MRILKMKTKNLSEKLSGVKLDTGIVAGRLMRCDRNQLFIEPNIYQALERMPRHYISAFIRQNFDYDITQPIAMQNARTR